MHLIFAFKMEATVYTYEMMSSDVFKSLKTPHKNIYHVV